MAINFGFGINLYNKMPLLMQSLIGIILSPVPAKYRGHGVVFRETERISKGDFSKLRENQETALIELVKHAYRNTEYYRNVIDESDIDVEKFEIKDLKRLPILTKGEVRGGSSKLRASNYRSFSPGLVRTSGSTGEPLEFLIDQQTRVSEYASEWRCLVSNGVTIGGKTATFRGNHYRENRGAGAHWFKHALSNELNFNTYSMTQETCEKYVEKLIRYAPEIIRGFPSSLSTLSSRISRGPILPESVAFCSSEMMDESMRRQIQEKLCPRVINWYSQSEYVVSAGECPEGNMHINTEFGLLEVVDENGRVLPNGEIGRLVGTSLTNFSQPFIRYELDDLGSISLEGCDCGLPHPILEKMEGRKTDIIRTPDGRELTSSTLIHWWKHYVVEKWDLDVFEWVQLVQRGKVEIAIRVVPKIGVNSLTYKQKITEAVSELWGSSVSIEVEELKTAPHGQKWRFAISEMGVD